MFSVTANPWFVRCILPNDEKKSRKVDMPCLLNQIHYYGLLSTVQIRKQGYPIRLRFQHFVERYRYLLKPPIPRGTPYRDLCRLILDTLSSSNNQSYQLGATRVFIREALHRVLENGRSKRMNRAAAIIQKNVRSVLLKQKNLRKEKSAVLIQKVYRGYKDRKSYQSLKKAAVTTQAMFRGKKERNEYEKIKNNLMQYREAKTKKGQHYREHVEEQRNDKTSSSHLDVPAELAFIFSKIDNWLQVHVSSDEVLYFGCESSDTFYTLNKLDDFLYGFIFHFN